MCGIAAHFAYGPSALAVDRDELARTNAAMAARGPDGDGLWVSGDGRVGLAHRRLAIIDLSDDAAQPMALVGRDLHVTYNGEIYNYRQLKAELESEGRRFVTDSDTEVMLHLYDRDGPAMLDKLRGMFALAIWDGRERALFMARDPFGIKPLYIADDGATLRCASQVKALIAGGKAGHGVDAAGHVGFFMFGHVPEPHTLYADIEALEPGSWMRVHAGGRREYQQYFQVTDILAETPETDAPRDLRPLLLDSVRHHLVADVPVGVFLSAGLDAATITALAAETEGTALKTVTLAFDEFRGSPGDEAPLAEAVAARYGTDHETVRIKGESFHEEVADVLAAMDQPSIDGVNVYFVAKAAKARGLKVALSGLGGDEMFMGYDVFGKVPALAARLGWIPGRQPLGQLLRRALAPMMGGGTSPKWAGLLEYGGDIPGAYLLKRALMMPWELDQVLDPDMVRDGLQRLSTLETLGAIVGPVSGARRQVAALEISRYMRSQLLRDADWAGMAHSVEIRVPMVDPVLFRALAPMLARPGGPSKQTMARTPAKQLPEDVLRRPKTGFTIPVREWLQGAGTGAARDSHGLRGWAREVYSAIAGGP